MRYLVTGSAGFIASRVVNHLLEQGAEVVGIDNFSDSYDVRLKEWRLEQLANRPKFLFSRTDLSDRTGLKQLLTDYPVDGVLNLAARAGVRDSVRRPQDYFQTNLNGTLNLLQLCQELSIGKLVQASTSSLYGEQPDQPFREEMVTDRPLSPYAASKKGAEVLCYTYHHLIGLDVSILRYFTVYGPAGRPDMSPFRFLQWISEGKPVTVFGDGSQRRDFTFVDDVAEASVRALKPVGFETFNVGSDRPLTLMSLIHRLEKLIGRPAQLVFEGRQQTDVHATWADISKAKQVLSWQPTTDFQEGTRRMADWYDQNREWAKLIQTGR